MMDDRTELQAMPFSDYVANTFFESLYAEHIGGTQLTIPGIKTLFDKHCPKCPIVNDVKFAANDDVQARARLRNARKAFLIGADAVWRATTGFRFR